MRLGIIDIGSNTMRLVVWEIYGRGYYRIIDEIKETVRLGSQANDPEIAADKMKKAAVLLQEFRTFSQNLRVDKTIVMATTAVRQASNREEFLDYIKAESGFSPVVLSADEESYLDYYGVASSMEVENSLLVDVGGSSTELVWIRNNKLIESASIPIGTLTLTEQFDLEDIVTSQNHTAMEEKLRLEIKKIPWLFGSGFKTMILVGGSARAVGRIDRYRKRYPLSITHNYTLLDLDVQELFNQMMTKTAYNRSKIQGLEKSRADIIMGALAILKNLCSLTGLQELRVSGKGIREGKLYQYIKANYDPFPDMLDASLNAILERHCLDTAHAYHVLKLSAKLFQALKNPRDLPESSYEILKCAALLHDSGMSIRYYDHEIHSQYIILNSEINGLNHKEILLAALAARFHRKNETDLPIAAYSQLINKLDLRLAEKLGLLIGIAESFERNLNGNIFDLECIVSDDKITIYPMARQNIDIEIEAASKMKDKFREIFQKDLVLIAKTED